MPTTGRARSEQELKQALAEALADARRGTLDLVAPLSRDLVGLAPARVQQDVGR